MKKTLLAILSVIFYCTGQSQTLYVPGTIGSSTNSNVGIGTSGPRSPLEVHVNGNNSTVQTGLIIQQTNPGSPNNSAGVSLDFGIGNNSSNQNIEGKITLKETYWSTRPKMFFSLWDTNNAMQDRMVIDTYGNVGIGTTTPYDKLHINGNISIQAEGTATPSYLNFRRVSDGWTAARLGHVYNQLNYGAHLVFETNDGAGAQSLVERMRISYDGYVGIGTSTPIEKLEVKGNLRIDGVSNYTHSELTYYRADGTKFASIGQGNLGVANSTFDIQHFNGNDIRFLNAGSEQLRILATNGNVGIGTSSPDAKLTVKGDIHTREVRVDMAGAVAGDYVFEKDYGLLSLPELETYINQNKHLPEVPSAKEMEANGLNLKEMNLLLLKKVEELSLYLIEVKKEVVQLQEDNQNLKAQVKLINNNK